MSNKQKLREPFQNFFCEVPWHGINPVYIWQNHLHNKQQGEITTKMLLLLSTKISGKRNQEYNTKTQGDKLVQEKCIIS